MKALLFCFTLTISLCIVSCQTQSSSNKRSDIESPKSKANQLWNEIKGFKSWPAPPTWEGLQESDSVHGNYVRNYLNPIANKQLKTLPVGSILVKEGFSKKSDASLKAITVMKRISEGNSPESWFTVRFDKQGKPTKINSGCIKCHDDAEGGDYIFVNDHL